MRAWMMAMVSVALLLPAATAWAELCPACKEKVFIQNIGQCGRCRAQTSSGAFKLCPKCSQKLKQCQACLKPLAWASPEPDKKDAPAVGPATRRKPMLSGPIRLVDRPVGRVVNDCLVLSREDAGQTAHACVGQAIIVHLTGDRTSAWEWKFDKSTSDAVKSVGEPRRKETPVEEGMVGGTVVFLFPFKAGQTGPATLLFQGGRPWDWEKNTTQTLKFNVIVRDDPKVLTENRRKALKADLERFKLALTYCGPKGEPFRSLVLTTAEADKPPDEQTAAVRVSQEAAGKIVDHLAGSGYLAGAIDRAKEREPVYKEPCYVLDLAGAKLMLRDSLGWEKATLERLGAFAKAMDGDAAKAMQTLLDALKDQAKQWENDAQGEEKQADAG